MLGIPPVQDDDDSGIPEAEYKPYGLPADDEYDDEPQGFEPIQFPSPLSLLKTGVKKLDETEARALRPFLIEAITGYSEYADKVITSTNRAHAVCDGEAAIWSDLTEMEVTTLADGILVMGKRVPHVALAVREVARTWHMVQAGIILVPRFLKTMRFYADNGGIALW